MSFSLKFHIFIVIGLTFLLGTAVKRLKIPAGNKKAGKLFPYAVIYLPLALVYAFVVDDLPLTGFSIDPIYDTDNSSALGPQSISRNAVIALIIVITSIVLNVIVWLYSLFIVLRHFTKRIRLNRARRST